ncbi:hypothetical protein Peur_070362 [Populus x canadensis]
MCFLAYALGPIGFALIFIDHSEDGDLCGLLLTLSRSPFRKPSFIIFPFAHHAHRPSPVPSCSVSIFNFFMRCPYSCQLDHQSTCIYAISILNSSDWHSLTRTGRLLIP